MKVAANFPPTNETWKVFQEDYSRLSEFFFKEKKVVTLGVGVAVGEVWQSMSAALCHSPPSLKVCVVIFGIIIYSLSLSLYHVYMYT